MFINKFRFIFINVHNTKGIIKFPSGNINLESADKCVNAARFFWCVVIIILKHIVISYTNIRLKEGIMQNIVVYFNIKLTI